MGISIKICGLTSEEAVNAASAAKVNYAGFIYFPRSPRHIPLLKAAALKSVLDKNIRSVSVLVDPDDALIDEVQATLTPDFFQLHGGETPQRIHAIKNKYPDTKIIKALPIRSSDDIARARQYEPAADMLLFDAKPPENMLPGGNGLAFDWALLRDRQFTLPWILSGGLNAENVSEAIRISGAKIVDVSSSVERAPGVKDPTLIARFVTAARQP